MKNIVLNILKKEAYLMVMIVLQETVRIAMGASDDMAITVSFAAILTIVVGILAVIQQLYRNIKANNPLYPNEP